MKITINNAGHLRDEFRAMDRHGHFSYEGMELLFNYLEELNPDYELDVVALCCDYSEDTVEDIAGMYHISDNQASVMEYLEDNTSVVGITSTGYIVYASSF